MKHVIIEQYAFTPNTKTVVVTGKNIRPEQLLLITNVTRGTVLYNFSDPSLGATITNTVSNTEVHKTMIMTEPRCLNIIDPLVVDLGQTDCWHRIR